MRSTGVPAALGRIRVVPANVTGEVLAKLAALVQNQQ
jgi:hypothetical protein